jgi:hypothetical protein
LRHDRTHSGVTEPIAPPLRDGVFSD